MSESGEALGDGLVGDGALCGVLEFSEVVDSANAVVASIRSKPLELRVTNWKCKRS